MKKYIENAIVPYLQRAPRHQGNSAGRRYAVHWFSKGLADYNLRSANLSDVQANDAVYHYPPPEVMAKFALQSQRTILALFIARSGGNVPAELVFCCQDSKKGFFNPFTI